jgi:hypothetical protein
MTSGTGRILTQWPLYEQLCRHPIEDAKYLSSSSLGFLKDFTIYINGKKWPPGAGQIFTPGLLFEQTLRTQLEDGSCLISKL